MGILRYCGSTDFAKGQWAGVELHEAVGKNNGTVGGKTYFQCQPKHGMNNRVMDASCNFYFDFSF